MRGVFAIPLPPNDPLAALLFGELAFQGEMRAAKEICLMNTYSLWGYGRGTRACVRIHDRDTLSLEFVVCHRQQCVFSTASLLSASVSVARLD